MTSPETRQFFAGLFLIALLCASFIYFLSSYPEVEKVSTLAYSYLGAIVVMNLLFWFGRYKILSANKPNAYTLLILMYFGIKLILSGIFLFSCIYSQVLSSYLFILPFAFIYAIFSFFGVVLLIKADPSKK